MAVDRDDRAMTARLRASQQHGLEFANQCIVLLAAPGDRILTSDTGDIARLAAATGNQAVVITCEIAAISGR